MMENYIEYLKAGSEIHIKKKNRGKFTKSAKAAGESVQEHARKVLADPNATPLQKKRANFARNSARWKHFEGGVIKAEEGTEIPFITTGRLKSKKVEEKKEQNFRDRIRHIINLGNVYMEDVEVPEIEQEEHIKSDNKNSREEWEKLKIKYPSTSSSLAQLRTPDYNYTASVPSENRERLRSFLQNRGLDNDTVEALLVQAGAESSYNHQIKNKNNSAYGLGQWIAANQKDVINHVNKVKGTNYTDISQLDFDDQAEALAWWYYDRNKDLLNSKRGVHDKVKLLAKLGLGPSIVTQGKVTIDGEDFYDTDEDWLRYFKKYHPNTSISSFDEHIANRYKSAGYKQI